MIPLSVLDLAPVPQGSTPPEALRNSLDLAQHAERWGFRRFWLAEHHNMLGIASAATAVVIGYIAAGTNRIRVGAGGIMLPNHAPIIIAEQFGTLESLYPGRIDLGLGRAPGTDQVTLRALRRSPQTANDFPNDVLELQMLLGPLTEQRPIQAVPGTGTNVPIWILGSSLYGAQLAGILGLPYAFASHFAPEALLPALDAYRSGFRPSKQLHEPYAMVSCNVIVAGTNNEAHRLFTSIQQQFTNMSRGAAVGPLPPPIDDIETYWSPSEKMRASAMLARSFVGTAETVCNGLRAFIAETGADEMIVSTSVHDHKARLDSFRLFADAVADGGLQT